jgi:hypothetical protein
MKRVAKEMMAKKMRRRKLNIFKEMKKLMITMRAKRAMRMKVAMKTMKKKLIMKKNPQKVNQTLKALHPQAKMMLKITSLKPLTQPSPV